jgi:hypothetical protein
MCFNMYKNCKEFVSDMHISLFMLTRPNRNKKVTNLTAYHNILFVRQTEKYNKIWAKIVILTSLLQLKDASLQSNYVKTVCEQRCVIVLKKTYETQTLKYVK